MKQTRREMRAAITLLIILGLCFCVAFIRKCAGSAPQASVAIQQTTPAESAASSPSDEAAAPTKAKTSAKKKRKASQRKAPAPNKPSPHDLPVQAIED